MRRSWSWVTPVLLLVGADILSGANGRTDGGIPPAGPRVGRAARTMAGGTPPGSRDSDGHRATGRGTAQGRRSKSIRRRSWVALPRDVTFDVRPAHPSTYP